MSADARRSLDELLADRREESVPTPPKGWVRALRDALEMTAAQLGERIGMTRQGVSRLEQAEADGTITLATLRKAAAGLGCRVDYVLVPEQSLEETIRDRARSRARELLDGVEHTMALEAELVDLDDRVDELTDELVRRGGLWGR